MGRIKFIKSMIKGFIDGATSYVKAFRTISNLQLWGYMLVPVLVSIVLGVAILGSAWGISDQLGDWIISLYPWDWGKATLGKIADVFGALFVVALGFILFKHLVLALASPFMSFLSEKIERHERNQPKMGGFSTAQMLSDLVRGLRIAFRNIIRELFFTLLLFLMGLFIPVFSPFVALAIFLVQAYYAGFGNMDFTLERHFRVRGSVQFVRQHWGLAIGNGTIFLLLFLTGIGFLVALPLGAVAATTETLKRLPHQ